MLVSGYWIKTKIQISNKMPGSSIQYPDEFILKYEGRSLVCFMTFYEIIKLNLGDVFEKVLTKKTSSKVYTTNSRLSI